MRGSTSAMLTDETANIFGHFTDCLPRLGKPFLGSFSTEHEMDEIHRILFSGTATNEESLAFASSVLEKITRNHSNEVPPEIALEALREVGNMGGDTELAHSFFARDVPSDLRRMAFDRILLVFTDVFPLRCENGVSWEISVEPGQWNSTCICWWDHMPRNSERDDSYLRETDLQIIEILGKTLEVDHLACKEAAIFGLGRWFHSHQSEAAAMMAKHKSDIPEVLQGLASRALAGKLM